MKTDPSTTRPVWRALGALGVVYGDIGTSPLYAMRQIFGDLVGLAPTPANVYGILSLVFWALTMVITVKYVSVIMRADNRGEGGILALLALVRRLPLRPGWTKTLFLVGVIGTALFFGDAVITPAISVLSAVEGLSVATDAFDPLIVPLSIAILVGLFAIQSRGTARVGRLFGPIMVVWFATLTVLGIASIASHPEILLAINPAYAASFAYDNGWIALIALGAVVLVVTGGEALYADMGHFGRRAVRHAWMAVVFPALVINYFGQGALLLAEPEAAENPFFHLAPDFALYPMVALATVATVIASQAVISGAYSVINQAMQLGLCPRFDIRHTSGREFGQIYVPQVTWALLVAVVLLVLIFRSSDALGAAYGIAVTGTMIMEIILAATLARRTWSWPWPVTLGVFGFFLAVDAAFFGATSLKFFEGGWFPVLIALSIYVLVSSWMIGRDALYHELRANRLDTAHFIDAIRPGHPHRVAGTAVYMARIGDGVPNSLLHNLKHNKILHERVVLLTVLTEDVPTVTADQRVEVHELPKGFFRVVVRYGFMELPNLPTALPLLAAKGLALDMMETTFFVGRVTLVASTQSRMPRWRRRIYFATARNSFSATDYFNIPVGRVVELGAQIAL